MLYLSGVVFSGIESFDRGRRLGVMLTPRMRQRPPAGLPWAADTGLFNEATAASFTFAAYVDWLSRFTAEERQRCLFATLPDRVGDAGETFRRAFVDASPTLIRALGIPAAFVAQPGIADWLIPWQSFDVLFLGGDNDFKYASATAELVSEAKERGKWVHQGRVNTLERWRYSAALGCDSADGTFARWGSAANMRRLRNWLAEQPLPGYRPVLPALRCDGCAQTFGGVGVEMDARELWQGVGTEGGLYCVDCSAASTRGS